MALESVRNAQLRSATVAVLSGGFSSERAVALQSAKAVLDALANNADGRGPRAVHSLEIELDGSWSRPGSRNPGSRNLDPARVLSELPRDTVFFLALHGGEGEGGGLQAFLETAGRAFVGTGSRGSRLALDKYLTRDMYQRAGIPIARGELVPRTPGGAPDAVFERVCESSDLDATSLPWIVKPRLGGSSVSTSRVGDRREFSGALKLCFSEDDDALVEELVPGVEASVAVLDIDGAPYALTPVEIRPRGDHFFDYRQKYDSSGALELCPPQGLDGDVQKELQRFALEAHELLDCRDLSRTDFIVRPDRHTPDRPAGGPAARPDARVVTLETNTLPGLVERSLLPRAAAFDGLSFRDVVLHLFATARARGGGKTPA